MFFSNDWKYVNLKVVQGEKRQRRLSRPNPSGLQGHILSLMLCRSQILSFAQLGALIYFCPKLMNF